MVGQSVGRHWLHGPGLDSGRLVAAETEGSGQERERRVMIGWKRRKLGAYDIALSSKDVAGLELCLLPTKLEADLLLAASDGRLPKQCPRCTCLDSPASALPRER